MKHSALLFLGAIVAVGVSGSAAQCFQNVTMTPGTIYEFKSPNYGGYYPIYTYCEWYAYAPPGYKVILYCPTVQIPQNDYLIVNSYGSSGTGDTRLVGTGYYEGASQGNAISLKLTTYTNSGRFTCQVTTRNDPCQCGIRRSARIVGGTETQVNELPYVAYLRDKSSKSVVCGAAIISNRYALTAAHCVYSRTITNTQLVVGDHDTRVTTDTSFTQIHDISNFIRHGDYNYQTDANDIALVKTYLVINWSFGVGFACLPFNYRTEFFAPHPATLAGWGALDFGEGPSPVLRKVQVPVITNAECAVTYPKASNNNFMCTFQLGRDSCQYDSGSGVLMPISGRSHVIGITSGGAGCGTKPALNTRVTPYLDWILQNSPDSEYCAQS